MLYLPVVRVFGLAAEKWDYLLILEWGRLSYCQGLCMYLIRVLTEPESNSLPMVEQHAVLSSSVKNE